MFTVPSILGFNKHVVAKALQPGDVAVDATVGNGHDTLLLAETVGARGQVFGFDVQPAALAKTQHRLHAAGVQATVTLIEGSHADWEAALPAELRGQISVVVFNLGYLPGEDKTLTTQPATTIPALQAAFDWLKAGGILSVVVYEGHGGGATEGEAVWAWAEQLLAAQARVYTYRVHRPLARPPWLLLVEKAKG